MPPPLILLPSGNKVDVPICDGMSIGDLRASIAAAMHVARAAVSLLPLQGGGGGGGAVRGDAQPVEVLGEQATVVLSFWEPWKVEPFECCFGDLDFFHPEPCIDRIHGFAPVWDVNQTLHVSATPRLHLPSWEDFCVRHRSSILQEQAPLTKPHPPPRLADFIWRLCEGFGFLGLQPDHSADHVRDLLQCFALSADLPALGPGRAENGAQGISEEGEGGAIAAGVARTKVAQRKLQAKLKALLPLLDRRGTFGSVLFPDALELVLRRRSYADELRDNRLELLATSSYFWCISYNTGLDSSSDEEFNPYFG
eukprot:CAMPEP_0115341248 /NCGR_PEP_ID=MMETSP0270-20121206/91577_1 /TAXON_ID=71861 /ORGANISM="Scrippsiella trochoidea, Strain CCMP3099" /LENGTH=309 /DNA_ID=CAMNT_0002762753 /DNA_START=1 /DNA_END=930 /DNA_ORIENTATION=-